MSQKIDGYWSDEPSGGLEVDVCMACGTGVLDTEWDSDSNNGFTLFCCRACWFPEKCNGLLQVLVRIESALNQEGSTYMSATSRAEVRQMIEKVGLEAFLK